MVSIQRTIGHTATTSLVTFSLENDILVGELAYASRVVRHRVNWPSLRVVVQLPKSTPKCDEH
jgi:hypothetical protein